MTKSTMRNFLAVTAIQVFVATTGLPIPVHAADSSVKRSPTNCMPSPESPANLITTRSSASASRVGVASTVTVDHQLSLQLYVYV